MPHRRVEREKIVLWPSLGEAWWIALLPVPPLGFAIWLAVERRWIAAAVFVFAFLLVASLAYSLLSRRSTSFELRHDGIEMRVMGRRARLFPWSDIEGFAPVSGKGGTSLGFLLRADAPGRRTETGRRLVGADVTMPSYLCGDPATTEALLRAAQAAALSGGWSAFIRAQGSA